jgi:hypothetical protein
MSFICNERSTFKLKTEFFGLVGLRRVPLAPGTIRYRIKDLDNDRVVRDWTNISPDTSVQITVAASDNAIWDRNSRSRRLRQRMSLVVQADPGLDSEYDDEFLYEIRNLRGYES